MVKITLSSRRKGIPIPEQEPISLPLVGELWYISRDYEIRGKYVNIPQLSFKEFKALIPDGFRLLTLREDLDLFASTDHFNNVHIDTPEYGPVDFWGVKNPSGTTPKYSRLFFRMKGNSDEVNIRELIPLTTQYHWVDTQLTGLEVASFDDAINSFKELGVDPTNFNDITKKLERRHRKGERGNKDYNPFEGVMATVVQHGEEMERIYVSSGSYILIFHPTYGTPLVSFNYCDNLPECIDMEHSGFPQELNHVQLPLRHSYSDLTREMKDCGGKKKSLESILSKRTSMNFQQSSFATHSLEDTTGFYLLKEK